MSTKRPKIALIGNPNSGKTTLFNQLTGSNQRVGNWSGVTVSQKMAPLDGILSDYDLIDLPGIYALTEDPLDLGMDEKLTIDYLHTHPLNYIINVVDAVNIERNLYLTLQLLEKGYQLIVIVNRSDLLMDGAGGVDCVQLSTMLGCPVFRHPGSLQAALKALSALPNHPIKPLMIAYPPWIEQAIKTRKQTRAQAVSALAQNLDQADIAIAGARYHLIEDIVRLSVKKGVKPIKQFWKMVNALAVHRWFGIPIFLMVMYALFTVAIDLGGFFQTYVNEASHFIFVDQMTLGLQALNAPVWVMALFVGLGQGMNTLLTFIPVIFLMFFSLTFLEESGYMARAAFVIDRLMQLIGLPGKSFVPMIVGFGCNVPAVMGARILEKKRDQILSIIMSPFMSCGARLAIFTLFVAAFFPQGGQNIIFLLYVIGIVMAVLTGILLKKTILYGPVTPLLLELPALRLPALKNIIRHANRKLLRFLQDASKLILPVCMLVGALNNINVQGEWIGETASSSVLAALGQYLVPIFEPMGIRPENWPAVVGLCTGILAKELVIGTLNALYSADLAQYGQMLALFDGKIGAFAYLLFILLYFPCVSVMGAMLKEIDKKWTLFAMVWTTWVAYATAVLFYQLATFHQHPLSSLAWLSMISIVMCLVILIMTAMRCKMQREVPTRIVLMNL